MAELGKYRVLRYTEKIAYWYKLCETPAQRYPEQWEEFFPEFIL